MFYIVGLHFRSIHNGTEYSFNFLRIWYFLEWMLQITTILQKWGSNCLHERQQFYEFLIEQRRLIRHLLKFTNALQRAVILAEIGNIAFFFIKKTVLFEWNSVMCRAEISHIILHTNHASRIPFPTDIIEFSMNKIFLWHIGWIIRDFLEFASGIQMEILNFCYRFQE